jgi:hypothetical protein
LTFNLATTLYGHKRDMAVEHKINAAVAADEIAIPSIA